MGNATWTIGVIVGCFVATWLSNVLYDLRKDRKRADLGPGEVEIMRQLSEKLQRYRQEALREQGRKDLALGLHDCWAGK